MKALRRSNTSSSVSSPSSSPTSSWIHLRSFIIIASCPVPDRGALKSPWSRRKRKRALSLQQWNSFFTPDGKLRDKGAKLLKIVRSGGVHPSIRSEVWPFLLGVYDLNSSEVERNAIKAQKRKEYKKLRRHCRQLIERVYNTDSPRFDESPRSGGVPESPGFEDLFSAESPDDDKAPASELCIVGEDESGITHVGEEMESSDSESSIEDESESMHMSTITVEGTMEADFTTPNPKTEDFATWQRIIRLDAVRANEEWITESSTQASVSEEKAHNSALAVGLKDYGHLEPYRLYHAARLVAILEAYALYDPEIGYCQGMSDLLSPILAVMEDDDAAFWCFVGFMRKARHNFRLDEVGIRRQLSIVSRIIKSKDIHLYRHLEKLEAEDCFFVYRMVVVLFRRELTFEQTACLWEVMWADQAAIRAGIGKQAWGRIRLRAPPTDDLLLFAIAACVLQRRKLIIERYSSMDEIMRECNSMAGQLDVWKLLDDAHVLVVNLHDRI